MKPSFSAQLKSFRGLVLGVALIGLAAASTGCSSASKNKLLIAEASGSSSSGVAVWAAQPGDTLDDSNLVIESAASPAQVATRLEDGGIWVNGLGRDWNNTALLAFSSAAGLDPSTGQASSQITNLTTTKPGAKPNALVESAQLQATVIRRGVYVRTADGCVLVTSPTKAEDLGFGSCAISTDERWLVSWGADSPANASLTIRDMRRKTNTAVEGLGTVVDAVALSNGALVMASVQVEDQVQGVLLDATNGSELGRTDKYKALEISPASNQAKGFVFMTNKGEGSALSYMAADASIQAIDEGFYLAPVSNGSEVTYLSFQQELSKSTVRSWSPGDSEPETLLTGQVGAGMVGDKMLVLREVDATGRAPATLEFWRTASGNEFTKVLSLAAPPDAQPVEQGGSAAVVDRAWVRNNMAYLQVSSGTTSSFVRIDMTGDRSDAPIENSAGLRLDSLDADGTALVTLKNPDSGQESILVVGPHDDEPVERATFAQTASNLIHEGAIYVTEVSGDTTGASGQAPELSVVSFRSSGKLNQKLLWKDRQIAGATWPEQNGATATQFVTVGALIKSQQAAQQAQQSGPGQGGQPAG
ncbi:unannotated protein [freshwater metagenome]|uniref:Unannotated protein n=1 Tax=freshwater metagenome TaxID=449393 RepID=A0A6J6UI20_9ZZZZ|nr:hypothetical protein [Actinomycetota bacterium]MTA63981.1 hypothetical protein [Actinomycetota bacterium]